MKKALHIATANIKRHKSASASIIILLMIVSALGTTGLSFMLNLNRDYRSSLDKLNSLHCMFSIPKEKYLPSFETALKNDTRVSQTETSEILFAGPAKISYGGEFTGALLLLNIDTPVSISNPAVIEMDTSVPLRDAVYLPTYAKELGFQNGDSFSFQYQNRQMECTVAGFFESNELSTPNNSILKAAVSNECYRRLSQNIGRHIWLTARCYHSDDAPGVYNDFVSGLDFDFSLQCYGSAGIELSILSDAALSPVLITSATILVFAVLIILISLLVIRFRVTNSIENAIHDIGVLKAAGYTSRQIIACCLAEYGVLSLFASFSGIILTIPLFPLIRNVMVSITGVRWTLGINPIAGAVTVLFIVLFLLLVVVRSCRRIKKLPPVDALRGGIAAYNFRHNFFPLFKGGGTVHIRLGLKNTFIYGKLYMMIGIIIAVIMMTLTVTFAIYESVAVSKTGFITMVGLEIADAELRIAQDTDADRLAEEIKHMPEVRKVIMAETTTLKAEGVSFMGIISDDFSSMETMNTHEGRFPLYDNEIAVPKRAADLLGKEIGDEMEITSNGTALKFIITGYFSVASYGGRIAAVTKEGFTKLNPGYKRGSISLYLNDGTEPEEFKKTLANSPHAEKIDLFTNSKADAETQLGTYTNALYAIIEIIMLISLVIISLTLTMVVRQIVAKRRRELGILKSGGFTAGQLAGQLAVSFLPYTVFGILTGSILGLLVTNPFISLMFSSTGVHNAGIYANPLTTAIIAVFMLLFTFAAAHLSAIRIKHVTVYDLLSE